jgi:Tfp pilus assembly protein PilN
MLVLAGNDISDREAEVTSLEAQRARAAAVADELAPYASFQQVTEARTQTTASLADSRFDWERVVRQLSLILPPRIYLSSLTASAGAGGEGAESAAGVAGPSMTLSGCGPGQDAVAGFVAALREIDGVTRVGLNNSSLSGAEGGEAATGGFCAVGTKAQFEIVVAFDAAPPSPNGAASTLATPGEEAEGAEGGAGDPEGGAAESEGETATGEAAAATTTEPAG